MNLDLSKFNLNKFNLNKYKHIIFDFDGTINTLAVDWSAYKQALHDCVLERFEREIDFSYFSRGVNQVHDFLGEEGDDFINKICEKYELAGVEDGKPVPQCVSLIKSFPGAKVVWSSNQSSIIIQVLGHLGILDHFEAIVGKNHIGRCKPFPDGFEVLKEKLKGKVDLNPQQTLFIGNSSSDSGAAERLGIDYLDVRDLPDFNQSVVAKTGSEVSVIVAATEPVSKMTPPEMMLKSFRVALVPFTEEHLHAPEYLAWLRDYDVIKFLNRKEYLLPISFEEVKAYIENVLRSEKDSLLAIHLLEGNKFIGTFKFGQLDWVGKTVDLGVLIGDREQWGKGIATEVYTLALDHCFFKLGMRKVVAGCVGINFSMRRVLEKLGFVQEACFRKKDFIEGKYVDHYNFGIFKEEYTQKELDSEIRHGGNKNESSY